MLRPKYLPTYLPQATRETMRDRKASHLCRAYWRILERANPSKIEKMSSASFGYAPPPQKPPMLLASIALNTYSITPSVR